MIGGITAFGLDNAGLEFIEHETSAPRSFNNPRVFENTEVVRDCNNFRFERFANVADTFLASAKAIHNAESDRLAQGAQLFGALVGL